MEATRSVDPQLLQRATHGAARVIQGSQSDADFKPLRLSVGAHRQRQGDGYMIRIRIPGGRLSLAQWRAAAEAVAAHASRAHLTLRQDLQLYHVSLHQLGAAVEALNAHGLTTYASGGSTVRNITAGILADQVAQGPFDPYPYAAQLSARLSGHPLFNALPRKFKIGFGGPGPEQAQGWLNDLGFLPELREGLRGFRVIAGGGLGASPQNGFEMEAFLPAPQVGPYAEAALEFFAAVSPADKPMSNRFKFTLRALGAEKVRAEIAARLEGKAPDAAIELPVAPQGDALWIEAPVGDLNPAQMLGIAEALEGSGADSLRISFDQRLLVTGLHRAPMPRILAALEALGLRAAPGREPARMVVCAGPETCNRGLVNSKALGLALQGLSLPASLHISGCQNGCSQHLTAPLSLQGMVRSGHEGRQPVYQLRVGRPVDGSGLRFGPVLGTLAARRVRPALERLIEGWEASGRAQSFQDWLEARGSAGIAEHLGPLLTGLGPDLLNDNGSDRPFEVALGGTECH